VPAVLLISLLTFVVWALVGPEPRLAHALVNAIAVLIIACPCALGLATPMSIMVGTGRGALMGILFRDAEALELLERVNTLVIDKTGTLTEGKPRLLTIEALDGNEARFLQLAASLERGSEHPLAQAILAEAKAREVGLITVEQFESMTGQGVRGLVDGHKIALGNQRLMDAQGIATSDITKKVETLRSTGQTIMYVSIDGELAGILGVADPIKASSAEALAQLRDAGVRVIMLTGDSRGTAQFVADSLGITEVIPEVMPQDKVAVVKRFLAEGLIVAMAGDGINDAPALAQANVGIAMGSGTDIAMHSAGVTLVKGDLRSIALAMQLSRATISNIRQNLFLAFIYNGLGVPIAAGVLYPIAGILLSPMYASAAMSLSSVSVIANALRLRTAPLTHLNRK
jgi:Cu+-exporting ATPase